jgi:16S rRNA (cytidine1402-2'-O)-methyltransferase
MLYLVGTPIGNMGDITQRAVETLRSVDIVACEDTRHTGLLLQKLGIRKPLLSYYKHKEQEGTEEILGLLREGKNVALVSDAGMPVISDPGWVLVNAARKEGLALTVVPGPTALTSALCLAGVTGGFVFIGFLSDKHKEREKQLVQYVTSPNPLVFYCASHDIESTFAYLYDKLGDRQVYVVKELTKLYEAVINTHLGATVDFDTHGEFVLIVSGKEAGVSTDLTVTEHLKRYMEMGMDKKEAVKTVAKERGVPRDEVYKAALNIDDETR